MDVIYTVTQDHVWWLDLLGFSQNRLRITVSGNISCDDIRPLVFGMDGVQTKTKKLKLASILGAVILESKETKTTNKQKSLNSK